MAILPLNDTYYEIIDGESPTKVSFNQREAVSYITFLVTQAQITGVQDGQTYRNFFTDVLGTATLKNSSYLSRTIPASHPMFPWLYAYRISDIKGVNANGRDEASTIKSQGPYADIQTESPPYTGSYSYYKVTVEFTSRNYAVYTDEQLNPHFKLNQDIWMPRRNPTTGQWTESRDSFNDRFEYARYTTFNWKPDIQLLTYGGGNFFAKNAENVDKFDLPISNESGGSNNFKLVQTNVEWNWYYVPFEMSVRNRIWVDAASKINSSAIFYYGKGSLLLKEIAVKKYEPFFPFSKVDLTQNSSVFDYFTEFNKNQYCDITFRLVHRSVPGGIVPQPNPDTYTPLNCKDVMSPHNRAPWPKDLVWYYLESRPATGVPNPQGDIVAWEPNSTGTSQFFSYPFANLFNYVEGA